MISASSGLVRRTTVYRALDGPPARVGGAICCGRSRRLWDGTSGVEGEPGYHDGVPLEDVHLFKGRCFVTSAHSAAALERTLRGMRPHSPV